MSTDPVSTGHDALPRLTFQIPGVALIAAAFFALCATPVAFAAPGLLVVYLLPISVGVWVIRTRTTVDHERLVVRRLFSGTTIPWQRVVSLRLAERSWVRLVLDDDTEVPLPAVRLRDLPLLSLVSGGRLADPGGRTDSGRSSADQ